LTNDSTVDDDDDDGGGDIVLSGVSVIKAVLMMLTGHITQQLFVYYTLQRLYTSH